MDRIEAIRTGQALTLLPLDATTRRLTPGCAIALVAVPLPGDGTERPMLLWIIFAVMTALATLTVLAPISRAMRSGAAQASEPADVSVYRDQLSELERDLARGVIAPSEAEAARTEIARRLLNADRGAGRDPSAQPLPISGAGRSAGMAAMIALPALAIGFYLLVGKPELPDQPLSARMIAEPGKESIDVLVARAEAQLAMTPEDGRGWDALGPIYLRLQRPADAATAFRNAIRLLGPTSRRLTGLGEALFELSGGVVTLEARTAFEAAVDLEPKTVPARMYLALALSQEGRQDDSIAAWTALLKDGDGQPWADVVRGELAKLDPKAAAAAPAQAAPAADAPGPSAADVAAASAMPEADRKAMIEGMVARLRERLQTQGGTLDEWTRLIRALSVLGRGEEARAAVAKARDALQANAADLAAIDELAKGIAP